jgi:transposase
MSTSSTRITRHQREARWRKLIERQAASGRSVAAFCRDQSIAVQTFYWWKARLGNGEAQAHPRAGVGAVRFIDLGAAASMGACDAASGTRGHRRAPWSSRRDYAYDREALMFFAEQQVRVFLYGQPVDMRRSFDGLYALARQGLQQDPLSGHLFAFINRRADQAPFRIPI